MAEHDQTYSPLFHEMCRDANGKVSITYVGRNKEEFGDS